MKITRIKNVQSANVEDECTPPITTTTTTTIYYYHSYYYYSSYNTYCCADWLADQVMDTDHSAAFKWCWALSEGENKKWKVNITITLK